MIKLKQKDKIRYLFYIGYVIITAVFIGYTLIQFNRGIEERVYQKQIDNMKTISMQGSSVVQKKMDGINSTLHGLAEFITEEDIENDATIEKLRGFLDTHETEFQRIGLSGLDGKSRITNGEEMNILDRDYFQNCLSGAQTDTEIRYSPLSDEMVCIVSVPVLNEEEQVIGVLYGVMDLSAFQIYKGTVLEDTSQYIQIIDKEGNYIEKQESGLIGKRDNIFDGLGAIKGQKTADEIRKKVREKEQVYTEVKDGAIHEILYFTPLMLNNWCIVTVIDYSEVEEMVSFILGTAPYKMTVMIIVAMILLFLFLMVHTVSEYKEIRELSRKLQKDEKILSIASEKAGFVIMEYDLSSQNLRFINSKILNTEFPKEIQNAPENIAAYLPEDTNLRKQINEIFREMHQKTETRKVGLSFLQGEEKRYLHLHLIPTKDTSEETVSYIGVMEDDMEGQFLREKAEHDELTGLYNRSGAISQYERMLRDEKALDGRVYAYIIMDLDNFKHLNDTLGHQMGDQALQDVARILTKHFRSYDVICRFGGDEFFVFLRNIPRQVIERNIGSLLKKLVLTYEKDGHSIEITASAGVIVASQAQGDFSKIYRLADKALYQVKHSGKNSFQIYEIEENPEQKACGRKEESK